MIAIKLFPILLFISSILFIIIIFLLASNIDTTKKAERLNDRNNILSKLVYDLKEEIKSLNSKLYLETMRHAREVNSLKGKVKSTDDLMGSYLILGLKSTATKEEVRKRYKVLANLYHPDKSGSNEFMKRINDAYRSIVK